MANKTIPQLPEQTGKTDDDLLVIVDSGETTTSKIKVSTLLDGVGGGKFIAADGTNNVVPDYYATTAINSSATESVIIGGSGNTITSAAPYSSIFGGQDNTISSVSNRFPNTIIGSYNSDITSNLGGIANIIAGGYECILDRGGYGTAVIGGWLNETDNNNAWAGITAGGVNNLSGGNSSGVFAGENNDALKRDAVVIGGKNNLVNHDYSVVLGGQSQSSLQNEEVVVPKLRTTQYASLNFSGDTAAAAGGVQLGEFYHDNGAVRIRIV